MNLQQQAAEYLAQDKYSEAIDLYKQCIEANPTVTSNYWKLGLVLLLQENELEAQSVWLSSVKEKSEQIDTCIAELVDILEAEAIHRLKKDKFDQAEKIYCQIIKLSSNNIEAYKKLGNTLVKQNKLEEAVSCYQQALSIASNHISDCYNPLSTSKKLYLNLMKLCLTNSIYENDKDLMRGKLELDEGTARYKCVEGVEFEPDQKVIGNI